MIRARCHRYPGVWLFAALLMLSGCGTEESPSPPESNASMDEAIAESPIPAVAGRAEFVTSAACQGCHAKEVEAWTGSHHDRAMERATEETVLGDFADASFDQEGIPWRFFRSDETFFVNTIGPDGDAADFEILHTFGVYPLQQYLVALPGGRLQALTVAWDTRSRADGGQRWFSLYPDEVAGPGDVMHWTGIANRWNTMCASCHSTNLRKNFDSAEATYETRWSEIDVACEACHGPGSLHVEWAKSGADSSTARGFTRELGDGRDTRWAMNPNTGIASRVPPLRDDAEIEMCSGCHSRRSLIDEEADGSRFLDRHVPALLNEGLYYADGQIEDEVYVYGSFIQSKMYHAGVRCGDCHEPHSLALRESGNDLCAQCHAPSVFAVRSHHQHSEASSGASCVECHMPSRTYMVVDDRRDHSFRIPRPDLSIELGSPNACNGCHSDRDATWAVAEITKWPKGKTATPVHYGQALAAGRRGAVGGQEKLLELAANVEAPAIARASAVSLLTGYSGVALVEAIRLAAADADPLMRLAAIRAADALPVDERTALVGRLLLDQVRAVRIEAARSLAGADPARLGPHLSRALEPALAEYRHAQELDADRPNAHVNLALLELSMGQPVEAEARYKEALEVGAYFLPTYSNYADLLRGLGRDQEGEELLLRGLEFEPDSADLRHALGLVLVRLGRADDAAVALRRAAELAPENARYAYVFSVALYSGGAVEPALDVLRAAHERHPVNLEILQALASIGREAGHEEESLEYLQKLQALTQPVGDGGPPGDGDSTNAH